MGDQACAKSAEVHLPRQCATPPAACRPGEIGRMITTLPPARSTRPATPARRPGHRAACRPRPAPGRLAASGLDDVTSSAGSRSRHQLAGSIPPLSRPVRFPGLVHARRGPRRRGRGPENTTRSVASPRIVAVQPAGRERRLSHLSCRSDGRRRLETAWPPPLTGICRPGAACHRCAASRPWRRPT